MGQLVRNPQLHRVRRQALLETLQRHGNEVIQRLPVAPRHDLAGLETHQVQNVRHETRHLRRLRLNRACQRHTRGFVEQRSPIGQRASCTRDDGKRCPKIVGDRGKQRVAQALALASQIRFLGRFR